MRSCQPEKVIAMIKDLCNKHQGEILSVAFQYEVLGFNHPNYGEVQMAYPVCVIDFK